MGPVSSLEARAEARPDAARPRHPAAARTSSVLLILLSFVILLVGLVSEQISMLRFEGRL